jgi:queuine tRNA-ribosyltransferase
MPFKVLKKSSSGAARLGELITPRGVVETPIFMPVGTRATVKPCPRRSSSASARSSSWETPTLCSSRHGYHVEGRRPAQFACWERPILKDSGGFQVFSLAKLRKIPKMGV